MRKIILLLAALAILGPTGRALADTFATGSLIIPMDTTYQDSGMLKAFGLVYELLANRVPVRWVIAPTKMAGETDFTAAAKDHKTGSSIGSHGYRGGPFVVDSADTAAALPIVDAWQAANPSVAVHESTAPFSGPVARYLVVAPKIALFADGSQSIAIGYLRAAGIPDSDGNDWPSGSADIVTPTQVAGPTTTNHRDGALFDADGDPVYCHFLSSHWTLASAQANPEVVAELREFLKNPVHLFAECLAVEAFENLAPYGRFLTPNGFVPKSQPTSVDLFHAGRTFAQLDGTFEAVGGSDPAFALPAGDSYKASGVTMIRNHSYAEGLWDIWTSGYLDGACPPDDGDCGTSGKISYLGGHQYTVSVPISTNPRTQGARLFLDSLFDSSCACANGLPAIDLVKSAPAATATPTVTYTIGYANAGPTVALGALLSDPLPTGSTFVSATGGGTLAGGTVQWVLGNLGVGESGSVQFTVTLGGYGTVSNTARLAYDVGLDPFTKSSNTTTTIYRDSVAITASAGAGGSIDPAGSIPVPFLGSRSFAIAPSSGYAIADVLVDGLSVGAVPTYEFTNVTIDHTISAGFRGLVGSVPGLRMRSSAATSDQVDLAWDDGCGAGQTDFELYEGVMGSWYDHSPERCSTGGNLSAADVAPVSPDVYFLVVGRSGSAEGSFGTDSLGRQIPAGPARCLSSSDLAPCP
jgi:uncharacterized repeat protein (TIGR01451 family)